MGRGKAEACRCGRKLEVGHLDRSVGAVDPGEAFHRDAPRHERVLHCLGNGGGAARKEHDLDAERSEGLRGLGREPGRIGDQGGKVLGVGDRPRDERVGEVGAAGDDCGPPARE